MCRGDSRITRIIHKMIGANHKSNSHEEGIMEKNHTLKQNVASITLFYVIITSIFELLNIANSYMIISRPNYISSFLIFRGASFVFRIVIIVLSTRYIKKAKTDQPITIMKNQMVRAITGAIVAIEGGFDLCTYVPNIVSSIQTFLYHAPDIDVEMKRQVIIYNILTIVIILGQIVVGIYLVYFYNKNSKENL